MFIQTILDEVNNQIETESFSYILTLTNYNLAKQI